MGEYQVWVDGKLIELQTLRAENATLRVRLARYEGRAAPDNRLAGALDQCAYCGAYGEPEADDRCPHCGKPMRDPAMVAALASDRR